MTPAPLAVTISLLLVAEEQQFYLEDDDDLVRRALAYVAQRVDVDLLYPLLVDTLTRPLRYFQTLREVSHCIEYLSTKE
jgi:hypothetical protein